MGTFSILVYFLWGGHTYTLERRAAQVSLFLAPFCGILLVRSLSSTVWQHRHRTVTTVATVAIGVASLALYNAAIPIVRANERSFVDMQPFTDALVADVLPDLPKPLSLGYISYENRWHVKTQLEDAFPDAVFVDESGPLPQGGWRERVASGWMPDLLVGVLGSRYIPEASRREQEREALQFAARYQYQPVYHHELHDDLLGGATVFVLSRLEGRASFAPPRTTEDGEAEPDRFALPFLRQHRTIAYNPTGMNPVEQRFPSADSIQQDLQLLHAAGFDGLITYGAKASLGEIPRWAREQDFQGILVMGLWDPRSTHEQQQAVEQRAFVDLYCVGNEGLGVRYNRTELRRSMDALREATGKPVTTSERIQSYLSGADSRWLLEQSDVLLPIAQPYWAGIREPGPAVAWTAGVHRQLAARTNKPILLKEVGLPHAGDLGCNPRAAAAFLERVFQQRDLPFAVFEAFDQPWKTTARVEPYWGVFDDRRRPTLPTP